VGVSYAALVSPSRPRDTRSQPSMQMDFESRPAYALVTVGGPIDANEASTLREVAAVRSRNHETMRIMIDLRDAELSRDARDAMLAWARAPHASASAFVTLDDLFVAELNMAALASGARVRAFAGTSDGHRWLTRGSMVKTPYEGGSSRPPPIDPATRRAALFGVVPPRASERPPPPSSPPRASDRPPPFATPAVLPPRRSEPPPAHYPGRVTPTSEVPTPTHGNPRPKR
jgi:hypothetical protein